MGETTAADQNGRMAEAVKSELAYAYGRAKEAFSKLEAAAAAATKGLSVDFLGKPEMSVDLESLGRGATYARAYWETLAWVRDTEDMRAELVRVRDSARALATEKLDYAPAESKARLRAAARLDEILQWA